MWNLNKNLVDNDHIGTLNDYKKVKASFKELRLAMADLERAVSKVSGDIPDLPPDPSIDP